MAECNPLVAQHDVVGDVAGRAWPERVEQRHRTTWAWFAEHGYLNEAADHALAACGPSHRVELLEQDGTNLIEQSKISTFLGIVDKLAPRHVRLPHVTAHCAHLGLPRLLIDAGLSR